MNQCNITSAVNELVKVRLDMLYADEELDSTTTAIVADSFDLYTFANASIDLPSGSTLAQVQTMDVTISNGVELVMGQGSRVAQEDAALAREYTGSISMNLQASTDLLSKVYGSATGPDTTEVDEAASLVMTFTNGAAGTSERSITMTYTGVQIDEESMPQDPTAAIMEDVSVSMRSLSIVAVDNTQTSL